MRQFIAWTAALVTGLPGIFSGLLALNFSRIVLSAVWTSVLERPDFREETGDVRIFRATDPDWFWGNVEFYSILSIVLWMTAMVLVFPLAMQIAATLWRGKIHRGNPR